MRRRSALKSTLATEAPVKSTKTVKISFRFERERERLIKIDNYLHH